MYYQDIRHNGLNKFRRVAGTDQYVLQQRVDAQRAVWDEQWAKKCEIEKKRDAQQQLLNSFESKKAAAAKQTAEAQRQLEQLSSILATGLGQEVSFDWAGLRNRDQFLEHESSAPTRRSVAAPHTIAAPIKPSVSEVPKSFLGWLIPSVQKRRELRAELQFQKSCADWQQAYTIWDEARKKSEDRYRTECRARQSEYEAEYRAHELAVSKWQARRQEFEVARAADNASVDAFRQRYLERKEDAVREYAQLVLGRSKYPAFFPKQWQVDFIADTGVLVVDYELPSLDLFPKLKTVKYVQTRNALDLAFLKDSEVAQIYDTTMYQTCLRTLHELFSSDDVDALKSITFNGWVNFIDKSNGRPARSCIMSVQANKAAFQQINLSAVDPKTCFRSLKGVGSSKLAGMAAVVPILRLNKSDERFVPARDVIDGVVEATNIAAISWEEFEYLVRDLFEKEFSTNGGEVKITRASRDHGVDAVAFDPDPIRGGKIVIQAKRYTNVVGVSAVRDLYGTLINEGANRGILVTTSQYGPDSYEFAKDKPITLLDGGNLLSLLDRHGHKARIDLAEAKKLGASREER
jgi:restriction system protein